MVISVRRDIMKIRMKLPLNPWKIVNGNPNPMMTVSARAAAVVKSVRKRIFFSPADLLSQDEYLTYRMSRQTRIRETTE